MNYCNFKILFIITLCDEKNQGICLETEEIKFSSKFAQEMEFFENRGKFELKNSIGYAIPSIRVLKKLNINFKTQPYLSPLNQASSQTDITETDKTSSRNRSPGHVGYPSVVPSQF
jgi:hypothetical protein